jgi:multiple sugar transport system permease protein
MAIAAQTEAGRAPARPVRAQGRRALTDRSETRAAVLFLAPALVLVALFRIFPLAWGFVLSLTDSNGIGPANFVGLDTSATASRTRWC